MEGGPIIFEPGWYARGTAYGGKHVHVLGGGLRHVHFAGCPLTMGMGPVVDA